MSSLLDDAQISKHLKQSYIWGSSDSSKQVQVELSNHLIDAQTKYKKAADERRLDSAFEEPKY